jgi:hypothetical protein
MNKFDTVFTSLLESIKNDEVFNLDEACTKVTQKTSSSRDGKKWMKCAKQPDGSIKKIHWGQAGVRVGKDNPKRRKSFRARHKCSTAKPGSPKAMACKDW